MAPKKKGNKKAQDDDWEADMGETIAPQNGAAEEPMAEEAAPDADAGGGDLMAYLQRRGKKKKNKGADVDVEGEDPAAGADAAKSADASFDEKAPQEGTFDDDEDVFAGNYGKKKGKAKGGAAEKKDEPKDEDKADDGPRVKTKAEKEKEKKEKEKQRKKELVCSVISLYRLLCSRICG